MTPVCASSVFMSLVNLILMFEHGILAEQCGKAFLPGCMMKIIKSPNIQSCAEEKNIGYLFF